VFQTRILLSLDPEASFCPSGDQDTLWTVLACPLRGGRNSVPVSVFQSRMVPSLDPEASFCPSGDQATLTTLSDPTRVWRRASVLTSQIRTVPSSHAEVSFSPSGDQAILLIGSV